MPTVEEIKAATAALPPEDQVKLFRWWVGTDVFRVQQVAALKAKIAAGIEDLEAGRFYEYDENSLSSLAKDISQSGRAPAEVCGQVFAMSRHRLSEAARLDLDGVWNYIAQDNPEAADRFTNAIVSRFSLLASIPEMGRPRE